MLILSSTNDKLQLVTSAAQNIDFQAAYLDLSASAQTPGRSNSAINLAATTDVVTPPSASTCRIVKQITAVNKGGAQDNLTIQHTDGNITVELVKFGLFPGDQLQYTDRSSFTVFDPTGRDKGRYAASPNLAAITPGPNIRNNSGPIAVGFGANGTMVASYFGRAPSDLSSITVLWRQVAAASTVTFAQLGVGIQSTSLDAAIPRITLVGFSDISAKVTSTGLHTAQITGLSVKEGDGIWIVVSISAGVQGTWQCIGISQEFNIVNDTTLYACFTSTSGLLLSSHLNSEIPFQQVNTAPYWYCVQFS